MPYFNAPDQDGMIDLEELFTWYKAVDADEVHSLRLSTPNAANTLRARMHDDYKILSGKEEKRGRRL